MAQYFAGFEFTPTVLASVITSISLSVLSLIYILYKIKFKYFLFQSSVKPRFRKRDKVMFYGRKMLRKVGSKVGIISSSKHNRTKKRQIIVKLYKKLMRLKEKGPQLEVKEPPQSLLEAEAMNQKIDSRLPPEVLYMLRSVRVFGHFEKPLFLELCKYMETMFVPKGQYLFRVGEPDDSIFVVQSGCINVLVTENDGVEYVMKQVITGDSIHSLLSLLDVLTGHHNSYKTVSASAEKDSTVLRLPAVAFQELFARYPESLVRVVQIITVRLQRVTFTALHNYLGLSSELIRSISRSGKTLAIHQLTAKSDRRSSHCDSPLDTKTLNKMKQMHKQVHSTKSENSRTDSSISHEIDLSHETNKSTQLHDRECTRDDKEIAELAREDLLMLLKLKDASLLDGCIHIRHYKANTIIVAQGDQESHLYFLVSGKVSALQKSVFEGNKETYLFKAYPGEIIGSLALLTGEQSFFTFQAKKNSIVAVISKAEFYRIMKQQPSIVLNIAHTVVTRMSPFTRQIDFALDWMMVEAGCALYRQGDIADITYIVLTGRLRSVLTLADGKKAIVGEYGRSEIVGIVEAITQTERATTVMAIRDTEVAAIPSELLTLIKRKYPHVVTRLIHLLGKKILGNIQGYKMSPLTDQLNVENKSRVTNLSTVAIVPISRSVPLIPFTLELKHALSAICQTVHLNSDIVKKTIGTTALENVNEFRLNNWLGQHEDDNEMVIYQCDDTFTKWTRICIRQADCILIVGLAHTDPYVLGEIESKLENLAVRAQKELVLLHKESDISPNCTANWLNARGWVSRYHHIQCPNRVFKVQPLPRVLATYKKLSETLPARNSDFSRLARILTGTSIGLILGGGGARGLSQVGIIKSFTEAGIPIDMVGGTSIGSLVGALWCESRKMDIFFDRIKEYSKGMTSIWEKIFDLTYPITSMFSGSAFNRINEMAFKDRQIEDLWIPYFCVSTDITSSTMRVHTNGSLWRYVRSSMSLAGYLPPLCDPKDGHLLLDGGYVNNLPADVMRAMGVKHIFAVDVGSRDDGDLSNYGDKLSGWWLLWKRWNPWATPIRVPDMTEIQSRLAFVSCERQLEMVRNCDWCEYIRPPIDKYRTLQFGSFNEIYEVGYEYGCKMLAEWSANGRIDKLFMKSSSKQSASENKFTSQAMSSNFTDLAELISKIDSPKFPKTSDLQSHFLLGDSTTEIETDTEVGQDEDISDYSSSNGSQASIPDHVANSIDTTAQSSDQKTAANMSDRKE